VEEEGGRKCPHRQAVVRHVRVSVLPSSARSPPRRHGPRLLREGIAPFGILARHPALNTRPPPPLLPLFPSFGPKLVARRSTV
jgi:hypothetical protein